MSKASFLWLRKVLVVLAGDSSIKKQRDVLSSYYEKGMTETGQAYLPAIEGAASETGLTVEQVKVV